MSYADLLLHIDSYPTPTTPALVQEAVALAASLGGKVTGLATEIDIPLRSNRVADYLIGLGAMVVEEEAKSRAASHQGLAEFATRAADAGVFQASFSQRVSLYDVSDRIAQVARNYDLCLLPLAGGYDGQVEIAQAVVFSSGRPALIFRAGDAVGLAKGPDLVVVAWDGSRCAARAMSDALPILKRARRVRLITVLNEKRDATEGLGAEAQRHLRAHGVEAVLETVDAEGAAIGKVLDRYVAQHRPDLLVMGAYGHSRAREFLLGGATEHALQSPPCAVFLSH